IALSYQRQNGYVMPLLQRVVSPLRKGDPMMMASVFAEAPKEMRLDWQMFYENMRLNCIFGISNNVWSYQELAVVGSRTPPERLAQMMMMAETALGGASGLLLGIEGVLAHPHSIDAKMGFFTASMRLRYDADSTPLATEELQHGKVYVLRDLEKDKGAPRLLYSMSEREGVEAFISRPVVGSEQER